MMIDPVNLPIIDIEASGLHRESYPIEIAIKVNGAVHSWLIKPLAHWRHWDPNAEDKIHGISRLDLIDNGTPARDVAIEINKIMEGTQEIYSDAAMWDGEWLNKLFFDTGVQRGFLVQDIRLLMNGTGTHWFDRAKRISLENGRVAHRAEADVEQIAQLAGYAIKHFRAKGHE